jgi:glutamate carboxypeptidase
MEPIDSLPMDRMHTPPAPPCVSDTELAAIVSSVERGLPALLTELESLVSIDCGSYTKHGVDAAGARVAAALAELGALVFVHPHGELGDTVVGTFAGAPDAARLLLLAHLDTVFAEGTAAARPFLIADGRATGPGVTDMKAGLLAGIHAVAAARAAAGPALGPIVFVANPDEEIGSPSSTPLIRALAAETDVALVLECARANGDIVSSRKGTVGLRLTVHGRAAHAGVEPEKGRSAILEAAHLVTALHALPARWSTVTCNVGVIAGGTRPNVVAEHAVLEADLRAATVRELDEAIDAVRALAAAPTVADVTVEVEETSAWRPMENGPRTAGLVRHATDLAARLGFSLRDAATGGASDGNTTAGMGAPTLDGLGPVGGLDHSPGEYIEVDSIVPRTALLAALHVALSRDPAFAPGARS